MSDETSARDLFSELPLTTVESFIAAEDKEFQASLSRDTRILLAGMNPQVTPSEERAAST